MLSFQHVETFSLGAAAVIDTALLLALLERHNWRRVALTVIALALGTWAYHAGAFVKALLPPDPGVFGARLQLSANLSMSLGLLLIPSALLHSVWRLADTGFTAGLRQNKRYLLVYLPLLILVPVSARLAADPTAPYLQQLAPFVKPYVVWLGAASLVAASGFFLLGRRIAQPEARLFLAMVAFQLLLLAAFHAIVFLYALKRWPELERSLVLVAILSPLALVLLFAYFVVRYRFMQLVLQRTFVYAVVVFAVILFHQVVLQDVWDELGRRFSVNFALIEATAVTALIMCYRPARQRTAEALRYLLGSRIAEVRDRTRDLAVEISSLSGQAPGAILDWFSSAARDALGVDFAAAWLFSERGPVVVRAGAAPRLPDAAAIALEAEMTERGLPACSRHEEPSPEIEQRLEQADAAVAVAMRHPQVRGLVLFGGRRGNLDPGDEQVNAMVLLVEQLAITLASSMLQAERLAAERRALQSEKLSTLGLVASSIAHEVKNPLSSIKTLATVLAEDLGESSPHAEELRLIRGEIDRLADTITQMLQFARPATGSGSACLKTVVEQTLRIMRHAARKRGVEVESELCEAGLAVQAREEALREIVLNLVSNAIDAAAGGAGQGDPPRVSIRCHCRGDRGVLEVRDNGPGIAPEVQDRLFEPFATTKPHGTGLGLYVVGRHVRELGGEIRCESSPDGTHFRVELPAAPEPVGTEGT